MHRATVTGVDACQGRAKAIVTTRRTTIWVPEAPSSATVPAVADVPAVSAQAPRRSGRCLPRATRSKLRNQAVVRPAQAATAHPAPTTPSLSWASPVRTTGTVTAAHTTAQAHLRTRWSRIGAPSCLGRVVMSGS